VAAAAYLLLVARAPGTTRHDRQIAAAAYDAERAA
jgi:hypothetical protein